MTVFYTALGATAVWVFVAMVVLWVVALTWELVGSLYGAFAVYRFASANPGALNPTATPLSFAMEVFKRYPFHARRCRIGLSSGNGGRLIWQGKWRFRVTAGDPDWRVGDEHLSARHR